MPRRASLPADGWDSSCFAGAGSCVQDIALTALHKFSHGPDLTSSSCHAALLHLGTNLIAALPCDETKAIDSEHASRLMFHQFEDLCFCHETCMDEREQR